MLDCPKPWEASTDSTALKQAVAGKPSWGPGILHKAPSLVPADQNNSEILGGLGFFPAVVGFIYCGNSL